MTVTNPKVQFGLYDQTIKQDATLSTTSSLQSFSDLTELLTGNITNRAYATYEYDYWLLDGEFRFMPDSDPHVGMMSLDLSDVAREFESPYIELTVDFSAEHSTDGFTLRFDEPSGNFVTEFSVEWYDSLSALIRTDRYYPTEAEFNVIQTVEDFQQIIFTFYSTSSPYRYLRLTGIDFGVLITFEGESIKSASVIEEIDPLSAELRINKFELELFSSESEFNILNPSGYYGGLQEHQPLAVYERVGYDMVFMGVYFLETWENTSDNTIKFTAVDLVGLMDKITTYGGLWTVAGAEVVQDVIADFMGTASIPYEFDSSLDDIVITGWLPVCSLRETIQQIAFAVGAQVDCSRSSVVKISPTLIAADETESDTITSAQKGAQQSLTLQPQIAGVEVTAHDFVENAVSRDLYSATLAAGDYEIIFDKPAHDLGITGGTITTSGANYALINVAAPGAVVLDGEGYEDTKQVFKITNPDVTSDIKPIKRVTGATLVNPVNVETVAQRVYDYYTQRYLQKVKLFASLLEIGTVVLVDTLYSQQLLGMIERMSIDLAMGMVAQVEIVGVPDS